MTTVLDVQRRLDELGYNPGPLDNIPGAMTREAVRQFQRARGLKDDGIVGPKTLAELFPGAADTAPPLPWLAEARRHLGLQEGTKTANRLMNLDTAAIPWCGAFVQMCIAATMPREPLPANPLWARDWLKFGQTLQHPAVGAVAVFRRGSGGHVGFVAGHDPSALFILGGNQSNKVSVAKLSKSRLLGYRWPSSWAAPSTVLAHTTLDGALSENEA